MAAALDDDDPSLRLTALEQMSGLGVTAHRWRKLLTDRDEAVRHKACEQAARFGSEELLPHFHRMTGDGSPRIRRCALRASTALSSDTAAPIIAARMDDPSYDVRREVRALLRWTPSPAITARLALDLTDSSPDIRALALGALAAHQQVTTEQISRGLDDTSPLVRTAAARAARVTLSPGAALRLERMARTHREERAVALQTLEAMETPEAIQVLLRLAASSAPSLDQNVATALDSDAGRQALRLNHQSAAHLWVYLGAVAESSDTQAILAAYLSGSLPEVTAASALEVASRRADTSGTLLYLLPQATDARSRRSILIGLRALLASGGERADIVQALASVARDPRASREELNLAIEALSLCPSTNARPVLLAIALEHPDLELAVLKALTKPHVGDATLDRFLLVRTSDRSLEQRQLAFDAIAASGSCAAVQSLADGLTETPESDRTLALMTVLRRASSCPKVELLRAQREALRSEKPLWMWGLSLAPSHAAAFQEVLSETVDMPMRRMDLAPIVPNLAQEVAPALQSANPAVRAAAAWALGATGGEAALASLEPLLKDPSPLVQANAAASLVRLLRQTQSPPRCEWFAHSLASVRRNVATMLAQGCAQEAQEHLRMDSSWEVRFTIARQLSLETQRPLLLRCALLDSHPVVREVCVRALSAAASTAPQALTTASSGLRTQLDGAGAPRRNAPFALELESGLRRYGWTDNLGQVVEAAPARWVATETD